MKMAVVGCEASGKTVFMCALADYYGRDAANNPSRLKLAPENAAANKFERLMFRQMRCQHQWPPATPPDHTVEIKWSLRQKGVPLASIDLLEFGGETFRAAFRDDNTDKHEGSVAELLKYLGDTDFFVVLVSIKALLADPNSENEDEFERETEALWVTRGILEFIRKNRPNAGLVIGLTQADKYRNELGEAGSPKQFFAEHWPTVASAISDVPVVDVASVSKTDENGNPAEGYRTHGILPVMRIFSKRCFGSEEALENGVTENPSEGGASEGPINAEPPRVNPLAANKQGGQTAVTKSKPPASTVIILFSLLLTAAAAFVWNMASRTTDDPARTSAGALPAAGCAVTNTIEKVVEKVVTNTVKTVSVEVITNSVEKIVRVPVTNTVQQVVEVPVTNTVRQVVEVPVTNTVEKIVKVEKVITNVVEKVIEKPVAIGALTNMPVGTTVMAPTNMAVLSETELQKQIPPGYRIWTDYNGRRIIARWMGVAVDESGITIVTRYNRRIDAVLWKFSPEDQEYIKAEIKRHNERGEMMSDGVWIRNPILKAK